MGWPQMVWGGVEAGGRSLRPLRRGLSRRTITSHVAQIPLCACSFVASRRSRGSRGTLRTGGRSGGGRTGLGEEARPVPEADGARDLEDAEERPLHPRRRLARGVA